MVREDQKCMWRLSELPVFHHLINSMKSNQEKPREVEQRCSQSGSAPCGTLLVHGTGFLASHVRKMLSVASRASEWPQISDP